MRDGVRERVRDLLGVTEGDLERDLDLDGVALGDLDLEAVLVLLAVLLVVTLLLGVWVPVWEAVIELVRDEDEPTLIERLGVLLRDGVREAVGERVIEAVADLLGV